MIPLRISRSVLAATLVVLLSPLARSSDPAVVAALKAKSAEVTETAGEITALNFKDSKGLVLADYQQIRQLTHLKQLGFAFGPDDAGLKALAGMPVLEQFSANGMPTSDDGIRTLGTFPALKNVAIFHPGKAFTGPGLEALAALPNFESLTVAGSTEFGDAGMAAIAKITHLKGFRVWHSGVTTAGIKSLANLKELKNLVVGQRLANKPPTTLADDVLPSLATMTSLEALTLQEARLSLPALSQLKQLHLKRLVLDSIDIPEADINTLKPLLPKTDVKWTAPTEGTMKRINGLFGAK